MIDPTTTRRRFLQQAALHGAAATAATSLLSSPARAIEPIERSGGPKFKFSVAGYSYRGLLTSGKLTLKEFVSDCAKMNLEGVEPTSYYFPKNVTNEYLRDLKQHCFRLGLDVSGTAVGNDFCHPPGKARDQQIASVKQWIERAEVLGAPVIRIFSGRPKRGQTAAEAHKLAVAGMEECCEYAGKHGVFLALENHGGLTTTVDGMLGLIRDVKSPWFGVNVDTGNFHGADVYADLAKIAPYALNVQVKVVIKPAGGAKQPSDFKRLAKLLRAANYRGYIVLEYEEAGNPRVECPKYVEQLREAFA